jgi:hypothetical protein
MGFNLLLFQNQRKGEGDEITRNRFMSSDHFEAQQMTNSFRLHGAIVLALIPLAGTLPAIDGGNDVFVTSQTPGWKTFEILSGNDSLGAKAQEGFSWNSNIHAEWDGLGAYRHDAQTLRIFINQEVETEGSITRLDLDPEALSAWIASGIADNTASNQTLPAGDVVKAVSQAWTSIGSGSGPVNSPCSGNLWPADTYGPGRGFADSLYLAAEEVSNVGHFWVLDLATRTLHEVTALGTGRWENAVPIDTGRTDTIALAFSEDFKSGSNRLAPMRLYVGAKNPNGTFLERNGLVGGTIYFWDPDGTSSTNATLSGLFNAGNGTVVPGTWVNSRTTAGLFSNTEDLHPNPLSDSPLFGLETVQACEGEGIFHVDFSQLNFVSGNLGPSRSSEVTLIFEAGTQASTEVLSEMDNLVWATDGMIYLCEDGPTGDVWRVDIASLLASFATGDLTPDSSQVLQILAADPNAESSGIIEISAHLNYQPGSIFLVNGKSSSLSGNQLALSVSPTAALENRALEYLAGPGGSITGTSNQQIPYGHDGTSVTATPGSGFSFLEWSDGHPTATRTDFEITTDLTLTATFINAGYLTWTTQFPTLTGPDRAPKNDFDNDGLSNLLEFAFDLDPTGISTLLQNLSPFEFLRRIDTPGLTVTAQFSTSLQALSWTTLENETITPVDSTFQHVSHPANPGFYRLKVTLAEE